MYLNASLPQLDHKTVQHLINEACDYAARQLVNVEPSNRTYLNRLRISRAIGALDSVKPFIVINKTWGDLRKQCKDKWEYGVSESDWYYDEDDPGSDWHPGHPSHYGDN